MHRKLLIDGNELYVISFINM